eukprot:1372076-Amorphochlora_amoeboformis.AAC.2
MSGRAPKWIGVFLVAVVGWFAEASTRAKGRSNTSTAIPQDPQLMRIDSLHGSFAGEPKASDALPSPPAGGSPLGGRILPKSGSESESESVSAYLASHHRSTGSSSGSSGSSSSLWNMIRLHLTAAPPQCAVLIHQHGAGVISEWLRLREQEGRAAAGGAGYELTMADAAAHCTRAS